MPKEPLLFQRLSIRRLPGVARGLPDYLDFAPDINIIFGPNGSGKSSTARALRDLIWRQADGELTARGVVQLGGRQWELSVDGRRATGTSNGVEGALPGIPAQEGKERYTLAMHELVAAEDGDLAQMVINASTGYDLNAAERKLGYTLGGFTTNTTLYRDYVRAKREYDELLAGQESLNRDQGMVARLKKDKESAQQAVALLDWNGNLVEFLRSKESLALSRAALDAMPAVLDRLSGTEYDDLQKLKRQLDGLEANKVREEDAIKEAVQQRLALHFPEGGLRAGLTVELEGKIARLAEMERLQAEEERALAGVVAQERAALTLLGAQPDAEAWSGATWGNLDELEKNLQSWHLLLSRKGAVEALITELEQSQASGVLLPPDELLIGVRTLIAWLKEVRGEERVQVSFWVIWLLAGLGIVSTLAAYLLGRGLGLVGLLMIAGGVALAYAIRGKRSGDKASDRRAEYERSELPAISDWTEGTVEDRLRALADQLSESRWHEKVVGRVEVYRRDLETQEQGLQKIRDEYERLKGKLLLVPGVPAGDIRTYDGMYWFVRYAVEWYQCYSERMGLTEALKKREEQRDKLILELSGLFTEALAGPVKDAGAATAVRQQLVAGEQLWQRTDLSMTHARQRIGDIDVQIGQLDTAIGDIYHKVGVEAGEEDKVSELATQVEGYREAMRQRDRFAAVVEAYERQLREVVQFSVFEAELETMTVARVMERMGPLEAQAAGLDEISSQIESIRARIGLAEGGNGVEMALKRVEDTVANLESAYDDRLTSMTGRLLTNALKKQADERDRPPVFRAADELLRRITQGGYGLRLRTQEPPAFAAFDTREGQWRELRELSTGTRIQLLLSVRLAFLESQEETVRVPIIADELLANSDRLRASAIMETLAEISREGRQVFYFTSQQDEVDRWTAFLADKPDISVKWFVLGHGENEAHALNRERPAPELAGAHLLDVVPEVGDLDHAQYGDLLHLRRFDPMEDSPGRLHVWYVFDDPRQVYALLKKGLIYWSQVESFGDAGGISELVEKEAMDVAREKVKILTRFQDLYRQGRARRIGRSVLERSGAVSASFIDETSELLQEVGGDPVRLLAGLDANEVTRFPSKKKEQLRQFLLDGGFISDDRPLDERDIWVRLLAFVSRTKVGDEAARAFVARVLGV